jgi:hypothetical protein
VKTLTGAVAALAAVALLVFVGVALDELSYASSHPYRYGPAKVIATAAGGGALLALAVALLAVAVSRRLPE